MQLQLGTLLAGGRTGQLLKSGKLQRVWDTSRAAAATRRFETATAAATISDSSGNSNVLDTQRPSLPNDCEGLAGGRRSGVAPTPRALLGTVSGAINSFAGQRENLKNLSKETYFDEIPQQELGDIGKEERMIQKD